MKRLLDIACWLAIFLCGCLLAAMLSYPAWACDTGVSDETQIETPSDTGIGEES